MSSCLLPTLVLLQSSPQDPELATHKPTPSSRHPPARQTRTKKRTSLPNYYRTNTTNGNSDIQTPQFKNTKMLLLRPLIPLLSLAGLAHVHAQSGSQSTWAPTQPFAVAPESSTDALLGSSQQPLTNALGATSTTALPPAVSVTDMFSVSIPTEVASLSRSVSGSGSASASVSQSSGSASASGSQSGSASTTPSASTRASSTSSSASAGTQSTGAAAGPQRYVGVVGALAGAAGVLLV